jgi:hypothetical protein
MAREEYIAEKRNKSRLSASDRQKLKVSRTRFLLLFLEFKEYPCPELSPY